MARSGAALIGIEIGIEIEIEIVGDTARPTARTRLGVRIAAPLATIRDTTGVSHPVLFAPPDDPSAAIDDQARRTHMLGSTSLPDTVKRVGIYREGYNFAASDTVDLEIRIFREDRPGMLARIGGVFRLGGGGGEQVALRETPRTSRAIQRSEGGVPVQMRSVVLDISHLRRGDYRIRVAQSRPRQAAAEADRTFAIR